MIFSQEEYQHLHALVFRPDYPGYKPDVVELPNGDGKIDSQKRYAHVAQKYLEVSGVWQAEFLAPYLARAHSLALTAAYRIGVPVAFYPDIRYSALRVLEYPIGADSNRHTDFDLFTLMMYRNQPDRFVDEHVFESMSMFALRLFNPQAHMGELGEAIRLGSATPHSVKPSDSVQHSIVYFAIPDHAAVLPSGIAVGDWIKERIARSRAYK